MTQLVTQSGLVKRFIIVNWHYPLLDSQLCQLEGGPTINSPASLLGLCSSCPLFIGPSSVPEKPSSIGLLPVWPLGMLPCLPLSVLLRAHPGLISVLILGGAFLGFWANLAAVERSLLSQRAVSPCSLPSSAISSGCFGSRDSLGASSGESWWGFADITVCGVLWSESLQVA
jgi:hypothetical protein